LDNPLYFLKTERLYSWTNLRLDWTLRIEEEFGTFSKVKITYKECRKNRAVILTTHSMEEADVLSNRIGIITAG
jgi:hypothetical protein